MITSDASPGTSSDLRRSTLFAALVVATGLVVAGCAGLDSASSERDASASTAAETSDPCASLTPDVTAGIAAGLDVVLAGASHTSTEAAGDACVVRYTSDADWVELRFQPATGDNDQLFPISDAVSTDGARLTRVTQASGSTDVIADASDPASISTWDASIAGASALLGGF
ncbi:MAG: hypothetical protein AAF467_00820 [Actinomycetota bacterium]